MLVGADPMPAGELPDINEKSMRDPVVGICFCLVLGWQWIRGWRGDLGFDENACDQSPRQ